MRKSNLNLYLILIVLLPALSCTDDYFELDKIQTDTWRPEFAIPLAKSTLTLDEVLVNEDTAGFIDTDENNILRLVYEGNVLSNLGGERINLPTISEVESISNIPAPPGTNTITFRDTMNFSSGDIEVDSMILKAGEFAMTFTSSGELPIEVNLKINGLIDPQGNGFDRTFFISQSSGGSNAIESDTYPLDGYKIDMTLGGTDVNKLALEYNIKVSNNGSTQRLINNLRMNTGLRAMEFKDFWGYIGTSPFDLRSDTFRISVLRNAITGNIYLSNPTLELSVINSYGLPLNLDFDYLNAVYGGSTPVEKILDTLGQPFEDNVTALRFNLDGSPDTTRIVLNNKSNIDEVVSKLVKDIAYDSKAIPNPAASGTFRNYVSDQSKIDLDVSLVLPLEGAIDNFVIIDTIDIELEGVEEIEQGELRTIVSNGFPLGVDLTLQFADSAFNILDSIELKSSNGLLIPAAPVDPITGKVNGRSDNKTDTQVSGDRWAKLKDSQKLLLKAVMSTTNVNPNAISSNTVAFEAENKIDISLGFKATFNID